MFVCLFYALSGCGAHEGHVELTLLEEQIALNEIYFDELALIGGDELALNANEFFETLKNDNASKTSFSKKNWRTYLTYQKYYAMQYRAVGQLGQAYELLESAIEMSGDIWGKNDSFAAQFYLEFAITNVHADELDQAVGNARKALALVTNTFPGVNTENAIYHFALAEVLLVKEEHLEGLAVLEHLAERWEPEFNEVAELKMNELVVKAMISRARLSLGDTQLARIESMAILSDPRAKEWFTSEELAALHVQVARSYENEDTFEEIAAYRNFLSFHDNFIDKEYITDGYSEIFDEVLRILPERFRLVFNYQEALEIYNRHQKFSRERYGVDSRQVARILDRKASLKADYGMYSESREHALDARKIRETIATADYSSDTNIEDIMAANSDRIIYLKSLIDAGYLVEAKEYFGTLRVELDKLSVNNPVFKQAFGAFLGAFFEQLGDSEKAENEYRIALNFTEMFGGDEQLIDLNINLASVLAEQNKIAEALALLLAIDSSENAKSILSSAKYLSLTKQLGLTYSLGGQFEIAEGYYLRAHATTITKYGAVHSKTAESLLTLADFYTISKTLESESILKLLQTAESTFNLTPTGNQFNLVRVALALSKAHVAMGNVHAVSNFLDPAIEVLKAAFNQHVPNIMDEVIATTELLIEINRGDAAHTLLREVSDRVAKLYGESHPFTMKLFSQRGAYYSVLGAENEANLHYERAIEIAEVLHPAGDVRRVPLYKQYAQHLLRYGDQKGYVLYLTKSEQLTSKDVLQSAVKRVQDNSEQILRAGLHDKFYQQYESTQDEDDQLALLDESFIYVQKQAPSQSSFAMAINRILDTEIDDALKESIQLWQEYRVDRSVLQSTIVSELLIGTKPSELQTLNQFVALLMDRSKLIHKLQQNIEKRLAQQDVTRIHKIHSLKSVQAALGANDALIVLKNTNNTLDKQGSLYVWIISQSNAVHKRQPYSVEHIRTLTQKLRCGLDLRAWDAPTSVCRDWFPEFELNGGSPEFSELPFDVSVANALYLALLGDEEHLTDIDTLHIVTDGPMTQLPLSVLVSNYSTHKKKRWLKAEFVVDKYNLGVAPSVSEFMHSRLVATPPAKTKKTRYLGIANPLLEGQIDHPVIGSWARQSADRAKDLTTCKRVNHRSLPVWKELFSLVNRAGALNFEINGIVERSQLLELAPLPETAGEVCTVAEELVNSEDTILLGANASEARLLELNNEGALENIDILHFATHAIVSNSRNPRKSGIVLTPPRKTKNSNNDGFLSAYEISRLNFNTDLAILSACNTGTSEIDDSELFGGLATAFLQANVKTLLVSNWEIASSAAVKLTTNMVKNISQPGASHLEALRASMLAVKADGGVNAHPAFWGPFTLVGGKL